MYNQKLPIRLLIAENNDLIRLGLRQILKDAPDVKIIGELTHGREVIESVKTLVPDVILMDIKMEGVDGLELIKKIIHINAEVKILVLTFCNEELYLTRVLQDGAAGYIKKTAKAQEILQAIHTVFHGQRYVSPSAAQRVVFDKVEEVRMPFKQLSNREVQIAMMIIEGHTTSAISQQLNLSVKTVNSYCYRIFKKLNIKGRVALVRLAMQHGLLDKN